MLRFVTAMQVRTDGGLEGYVPALSCLLPSPDCDAASTVKRFVYQLYARDLG